MEVRKKDGFGSNLIGCKKDNLGEPRLPRVSKNELSKKLQREGKKKRASYRTSIIRE